jgi:hypothetical protein
MVSRFVFVLWCAFAWGAVSSAAWAQSQPVLVGGAPGPYELHEYLHRPNSFDRAPYFATNPPVYYGVERPRSYGWTPYPYLGSDHAAATFERPRAGERGGAVHGGPAPEARQPRAAEPKKIFSLNSR